MPALNVFGKTARVMAALRRNKAICTSCFCVGGVGVQGVLTLFCSGTAQACHDDRAVELKEQLEVEEEDGDRQEEKEEIESGEVESKRCAHVDDRG